MLHRQGAGRGHGPPAADFGAGKIFFAESTFGGAEMTDTLFEQTGYAELARRYGIPLYNLNRSEAVEVE